MAKIKEMLAVRGPMYEACADHIVTTTDKSMQEIVAEIVKLMEDTK